MAAPALTRARDGHDLEPEQLRPDVADARLHRLDPRAVRAERLAFREAEVLARGDVLLEDAPQDRRRGLYERRRAAIRLDLEAAVPEQLLDRAPGEEAQVRPIPQPGPAVVEAAEQRLSA